MKYVIIGAGGTGGILGFYMTKAGKDVTLIARNAHLAAMKEQGLTVRHLWDGMTETVPVKAENMETYESMIASAGEAAKPDVILVCVKGYSLDNTVPFVQKIAKKSNCDPDPQHLRDRKPPAEEASGASRDGRVYLCLREYRRSGGPCPAWKDPAGRIRRAGEKRVPGRIKGDRKGLFRQRDLRRTF